MLPIGLNIDNGTTDQRVDKSSFITVTAFKKHQNPASISTRLDFQNFDQSQALKSQTKFSIKIWTKLQLHYLGPKLRHNSSMKILTKSATNIRLTSIGQISKYWNKSYLKMLTELEVRYHDQDLG